MESKTIEQQYKEVKLVYFGNDEGKKVSEEPRIFEYPSYASKLEAYLKDGWSVISFTSHTAYDCYTFLLGR